MKKIFTLISMAMVAMSMNAQSESYVAVDGDGNMSTEYAAIVDTDGKTATNVVNGNSVVKFATTNITVEAVGSGVPADKPAPEGENYGQDITVGAVISAEDHTYELLSINSTKPITWEVKNQGDISFYYIGGQGNPSVSRYAKQNSKEGVWVADAYSVVDVAFDPATGGEPMCGLYYKFSTKVDGTLKVGIWANKGNRTTFFVDGETKQCSPYQVEGYINGQNWTADDVTAGKCTEEQVGKKKWLTNDEIVALRNPSNSEWVIGAGNQPFWGNLIVEVKANKTYWFFQGNSQIGFQGYEFTPAGGTGIETVKAAQNVNAPMYNLAGQKVEKGFKGIAIQNGKKIVVK